jgi:hypothetical protein
MVGVVKEKEDSREKRNKDGEEEGINDVKCQPPPSLLSFSFLRFVILFFHEGMNQSKKGKPFGSGLPLFSIYPVRNNAPLLCGGAAF